MIYLGTSFNVKHVLTLTEQQFIDDQDYFELWPEVSEEERVDRLKTFYGIIKPSIAEKSVEVKNKYGLKKEQGNYIVSPDKINWQTEDNGNY